MTDLDHHVGEVGVDQCNPVNINEIEAYQGARLAVHDVQHPQGVLIIRAAC